MSISYHKFNFHKHTYCEFELVDETIFKNNEIHYKSKSGSTYFYTEKGVYRYSNHWGRVANCRWKINGVDSYKNQLFYAGFAYWTDFYALNNTKQLFYLEVAFDTGKTTICKIDGTETFKPFLMSLETAFKKQKEIKALYKNYKWALHFNDAIENVRRILITKFINSNEPLQVLKHQLRQK